MGINVTGTVNGELRLSGVNLYFDQTYSFEGLVSLIQDHVEIDGTDFSEFGEWDKVVESDQTIGLLTELTSNYLTNNPETLTEVIDAGDLVFESISFDDVSIIRNHGGKYSICGDCSSDEDVNFFVDDFDSTTECWKDDLESWVRRNWSDDLSIGDLKSGHGTPDISSATFEGESDFDNEYYVEDY